jgi:acetolactate synthase-1/2/3 large subunit
LAKLLKHRIAALMSSSCSKLCHLIAATHFRNSKSRRVNIVTEPEITGADAFLARLSELGIETIFANAGTDFPPIVEALSKASIQGKKIQAIAVPHENLAVSMAYGSYLISGRPQAIMLHVNVGTANAVCALMNAYRERIPLLVAAGRTPFTEVGHPASRSMFIHWAQEMFDQASLVRETVKWDYEVKIPEQIYSAVDRAISLATSEPKGPVYLTLPRETLATPLSADCKPDKLQPAIQKVVPDPSAVAQTAEIIAMADRPVIITASLGQNKAAVKALASLADRFAIPVVSHVPKSLCLPTDHPMHLGYAPAGFVRDADAIIVLECDVPWFPKQGSPPPNAKIIHMGLDPLFARYGIRSFPCDLALAGDPALSLSMLEEMIAAHIKSDQHIDSRRSDLAERRAAARSAIDAVYERVRNEQPIHPAVLSREIDRVKGHDGILINELGVQIDYVTLTMPGTYFQQSSAGGLGWGLGAALGAKLAAPDRFVIAAVGDGSYMFGNPTPAHYMSRAMNLPILFVVTNNGGWGSVRSETLAMYPQGFSSGSPIMPLTNLHPSPDFERVVEASGGYGERVESVDQLRPALERAVHAVKVEKRQALVNVICRML